MPSRTRRPQVNRTSPWPTAAREQSRKRRVVGADPRVSLSSSSAISHPHGMGGLDLPIVRSNAAVGFFFRGGHAANCSAAH